MQTYAEERGMQFALTKEGMYPEFSLDGIPYKAYRNPGKYRDEICCDAVHPEQLDTGLPSRREKLLRIARIVLPPVCVFAAIMAAGWAVTGGTDWLWLAALASGGYCWGAALKVAVRRITPAASPRLRSKSVAVVRIPPYDIRQRLGGGAGGGRVVHQHHAMGLLAGLPHDVAEDGACTGLAAHGVLGADVPVYIGVAFCSDFFFELLHQPAPAVAAAHGVGTAAREAQIPQAVGPDVRGETLL